MLIDLKARGLAIAPELAAGRTLLIAAHGNSLRAIVKHLFGVADEAITGVLAAWDSARC